MELLLSHSHLHGENNSLQSAFYNDHSHIGHTLHYTGTSNIFFDSSNSKILALQDEGGQIF